MLNRGAEQMPDRDQPETLAIVAGERGFERAATRGTASQRFEALEASLAQVLPACEKPIAPARAGEQLRRQSRRCTGSKARPYRS
jgi:hypothetical protein